MIVSATRSGPVQYERRAIDSMIGVSSTYTNSFRLHGFLERCLLLGVGHSECLRHDELYLIVYMSEPVIGVTRILRQHISIQH
jgi:hypothetical protein